MNKSPLANVAYWMIIITVTILGLNYYSGIIKPIVVALIIWYLIRELKDQLGRIKFRGTPLPRWTRGLLAFLVIAGLVYGITEIIILNVERIALEVPKYKAQLEQLVAELSLSFSDTNISENIRERISDLDLAGYAASLINGLSSFVGDFAVILVYVIFMILEEIVVPEKIRALFPTKNDRYESISSILGKVNESIKQYVVSKTLISLATGIVSYFILIAFGIDFAFLWSFLIFLLNYIPYIGPFIAVAVTSLFGLFQKGEAMYFVYLFVTLETVQVVLGNFVEPKVMGQSLNLSPLTVLIALAFWASLWGIVGMILAVPITAVLVIILSQFDSSKPLAILLSEKGKT